MENMLGSRGGGAKRIFQYCTDDSGINIYFRALQGHSGRNLIDPSLQDNVVIQSGFFQHIYHIGCAFNLHSIINSGLILGGQNSSKRQTVFFLLIDLREKSHKDFEKIDLNVSRRAQYLHNAWKRHHDAVYWVDINLAIRKGLTFYQTRSNAIIFHVIFPAYCIPKVVRLKIGEVFTKKDTCHLDLHQRSHYVTNGQRNWVRKLFNNQKEKLFDNQKEKLFDKPRFSNQLNQLQIQFVIDQGDLIT